MIFVNYVDVAHINALLEAGGTETWCSTLWNATGHEFGHAAGYFGVAGIESACATDPPNGSGGCIVDLQNHMDAEMPAELQGGQREVY